jgi:hypothetical protein
MRSTALRNQSKRIDESVVLRGPPMVFDARLDAVVNELVELVPPIVGGLSGRDPGVRRTGSWSRCG